MAYRESIESDMESCRQKLRKGGPKKTKLNFSTKITKTVFRAQFPKFQNIERNNSGKNKMTCGETT